MKNLNILVTGSSGLIGSAVCEKLVKLGHTPITMDIRKSPLSNFSPEFGDINSIQETVKAVTHVVGVIHLAAISRVIDGEKNPKQCRETNIQGTSNILQALSRSPKHPWLIYGSSREIYGEPVKIPVSESHPINPINVYGETKAQSEKNINIISEEHGFNSIIFRFSNVYGSIHDHKTRVIPAFMKAAINDHPLRVDSPDHVFDFTYVADVAEATTRAVEALIDKSINGVETFNVSPGRGTSLKKIVNLMSEVTGKDIKTIQGTKRNYDVEKYIGDVSYIEKVLDYRCMTCLRDGLELLYHDYLIHSRV